MNRNTRFLITRLGDQLVQNVRPALSLLFGAVASRSDVEQGGAAALAELEARG